MLDTNRTTSDRLYIVDEQRAEQLIDQYSLPPELTITITNNYLTITGDTFFAVQHSTNADDHSHYEPVDNEHFLADLTRITDDDSLPFTITSICQGAFDQHPGRTLYEVTRDTITMTRNDGTTETWKVNDYGIITSPDST